MRLAYTFGSSMKEDILHLEKIIFNPRSIKEQNGVEGISTTDVRIENPATHFVILAGFNPHRPRPDTHKGRSGLG